MGIFTQQPRWILFSVASGTCAALNGVFAKLTTTELTSQWVASIVHKTGLINSRNVIELATRMIFFILNLLLNGIMWTLFTKALALSTSTIKVSILNTSSSFMITAILGWMIFSESLPTLWFVGALFLVIGNVIIGRREETDTNIQVPIEEEQQSLIENDESIHIQSSEVKDKDRESVVLEDDILDLNLDDSEGLEDSDKD